MNHSAISLILCLFFMQDTLLFDFTNQTKASQWYIVDDVVMGGRSQGNFYIDAQGHGVFEGKVSLENNGGFSSVRHSIKRDVKGYSALVLKVKGDQQVYQIRLKASQNHFYSYAAQFETSGNWQTIEIPFTTLLPVFRGRSLPMDHFPGITIEEIAFLIGNKKEGTFKLHIDTIALK